MFFLNFAASLRRLVILVRFPRFLLPSEVELDDALLQAAVFRPSFRCEKGSERASVAILFPSTIDISVVLHVHLSPPSLSSTLCPDSKRSFYKSRRPRPLFARLPPLSTVAKQRSNFERRPRREEEAFLHGRVVSRR